MMFITKAAVSLFLSSLFLIPAAWKSFFHSGGMLRISKPLSGFQPILDTCLKPDGSEMARKSSSSSPPRRFLKNPPFFLGFVAGIDVVRETLLEATELATLGGGGGGADEAGRMDCDKLGLGVGGGGGGPDAPTLEGSVRLQYMTLS